MDLLFSWLICHHPKSLTTGVFLFSSKFVNEYVPNAFSSSLPILLPCFQISGVFQRNIFENVSLCRFNAKLKLHLNKAGKENKIGVFLLLHTHTQRKKWIEGNLYINIICRKALFFAFDSNKLKPENGNHRK